MKAKPNCLLCKGKGVIVDSDPCKPVLKCNCLTDAQGSDMAHGIPARYRDVSMDSFFKWWRRMHPDEQILRELNEARAILDNEASKETVAEELQNKLAVVIGKCSSKGDAEKGRENIRPAQEPNGFGALKTWILKDHKDKCLCWIDGAPGSGRSSLASAALHGWCERARMDGLFVSVRAFSQELKDTYYDTRSWQNTDFRSERGRMAPLLSAPCLVLDDFDRIDSDVRVLRAFAQLLDHRHAEKMPTILTALKWADTLQADRDLYPLMKLEDASLLSRLSQARRVELVPTLSRLMKSV